MNTNPPFGKKPSDPADGRGSGEDEGPENSP